MKKKTGFGFAFVAKRSAHLEYGLDRLSFPKCEFLVVAEVECFIVTVINWKNNASIFINQGQLMTTYGQ